MATLLLSAVGRIFGGPIGGAIGAIAGQRIDQALFGPKGRQGPRLNDLAFQSSSYGSQIPQLFGRMRVAGTVIWATDLREDKSKVSAGKGKPKQTVYSYSASFAVALSARPISRIGRIWADGNLLRGDAGDFKTQTEFRVYPGAHSQAVDPLIAAAHGAGNCPAYRGLAYVVFEDFQLADYGNRIPSLSFEVFTDETDVTVGSILDAIVPAGIAANCPTLVGGFAALGDSARGVAETLGLAVVLNGYDDGQALVISESGDDFGPLDISDLGATANPTKNQKTTLERAARSRASQSQSVRYYDGARDYQDGLQRESLGEGPVQHHHIDFPATLSALQAKTLARRVATERLTNRLSAKISLPWKYLPIRPGHILSLPDLAGSWRVAAVALDSMTLQVDLVRHGALPILPSLSNPGQSISQPDLLHGPTSLAVIDLPMLGNGIATESQVAVVAAGISVGWKRAALLTSVDAGQSWQEAGSTALGGVIGTIAVPLPLGPSTIFDGRNTIHVETLNDAMSLTSETENGLLAGRNLALVGAELVQFQTVELVGPRQYLLSGLLRGRRGTEWAIGSHVADERFVLIEQDAMAFVPIPAGLPILQVMASGVGDVAPFPFAELLAPGAALRPLAPAHVTVLDGAAGDTIVRWVRRSRNGWAWLDHVDAPIAEETERYQIEAIPDNAPARVVETNAPQWTYTAATRSADTASGATRIDINIHQAGTHLVSRPASVVINL